MVSPAAKSKSAGPWVAAKYFEAPDQAHRWTDDGWFRTGDVATMDEDGYVKIVDRAKDLVKSGGEWISSVDLENTLMGHPAVKEACVVGIPHPKWQERPLAAIVLKDGVAPPPKNCAPSSRKLSPSGSSPTPSSSSTPFLAPPSANSKNSLSANNSRIGSGTQSSG